MSKPLQLLLLVVCCYFCCLIQAAPSQNALNGGKNIICYYSSWSAHRPGEGAYSLDDIPAHLCTHLVYSFIGLNNRTWELLVLDPLNDITRGGYRRFTSLKKKQPEVKTLISVGGWVEGGEKYSAMASLPERRKIFVNSVVDFLKWFNFDGLDLDWEFPGSADRNGQPEDKDNFLQLVQELRDAFDKEGWGWSLSAVVPIMPFRVDNGYQVAKLSQLLDHIHLLTYDLRGNWTGFADVHTPLQARPFDNGDYKNININDGVAMWERLGAPREKIVVGLALYGRSFTLADPNVNGLNSPLKKESTAGHAGPFTKANGTLAYYEICSLQRDSDWQLKYDQQSESSYMVKGDQWIGFDDRQNLINKVKHFQDYGGVSVWAVDLDDFRGSCGEPQTLLNAIYKQLTGRSAVSGPPPVRISTTPPTDIPTVWLTPSTPFQPPPARVSTTPPTDIPTVWLTPSTPFQPLPVPLTTTTRPRVIKAEEEGEQQTPPSLSFEDSQRLQPKTDHFRTTVAPTPQDAQPNSVTETSEIRTPDPFIIPSPALTTRRPLRRRTSTTTASPTTAQPMTTTTTTPQSTTVFEEIEVEITTATTRRQRPLRVRGRPTQRTPTVAVHSDAQQNQIVSRNKTRSAGRQFGRQPLLRRTTGKPNVILTTVTENEVITTGKPEVTSSTSRTSVVTTASQPEVISTESEAEVTTQQQKRLHGQRRLKRPLFNRTAAARRPLLSRGNRTELRAEESILTPLFVRFPSARVTTTTLRPNTTDQSSA